MRLWLAVFAVAAGFLVAESLQQEPSQPPQADKCGVFNGTNSTCDCPNQVWKAWTILGVTIALTPVFLYALIRWVVFVAPWMEYWGIHIDEASSAFDRVLWQQQRLHAWTWLVVMTSVIWMVLGFRFAIDITASDINFCRHMELFNWYTGMFGLLPMALAAVFATIRYIAMNMNSHHETRF